MKKAFWNLFQVLATEMGKSTHTYLSFSGIILVMNTWEITVNHPVVFGPPTTTMDSTGRLKYVILKHV